MRNLMRKWLVPAACVLALAMSGCVSTHTPPPDRRVTIASELGDDLWITDIKCAKMASDHYVFQANVVNNTRSILMLQYRLAWLDANGIEIPSVQGRWQRFSVAPKDIGGLRAVAPTPNAVDFRFYVKGSDDSGAVTD